MSTADDRLDRLGDALQDAAAADLRRRPAPAPARPRRRLTRRAALGLVAAAIAVPGVAVAATQLLSSDDVAASMPAGTKMLIGTDPTCTVVRDQVEYTCTLARAPQGEIAVGQLKGTVEPTVDAQDIVNGGCRSTNADGTQWSCYIGQEAVKQKIIGPDLLGQKSSGPGVG
jgi:hypothetical protein